MGPMWFTRPSLCVSFFLILSTCVIEIATLEVLYTPHFPELFCFFPDSSAKVSVWIIMLSDEKIVNLTDAFPVKKRGWDSEGGAKTWLRVLAPALKRYGWGMSTLCDIIKGKDPESVPEKQAKDINDLVPFHWQDSRKYSCSWVNFVHCRTWIYSNTSVTVSLSL